MLIFLMVWSCLGVLIVLEAFTIHPTSTAVTPACHCVFFENLGRHRPSNDVVGGGSWTNGSWTFMSPNYPVPYEAGQLCLLYTFIAERNHLVQLEFRTFDLERRDENGKCKDYVHIYQELDSPGVNEVTEWQHELCGTEVAARQRFYSKGRALIFEFHSDNGFNNHKGFLGEFQFLDKWDYRTDGRLFDGSECSYLIRSVNETTRRGKIFSPNYPYHYQSLVHCRFHFVANPGQRIQLIVKELHLPQVHGSCIDATTKLMFYDVSHHVFTDLSTTKFRQNSYERSHPVRRRSLSWKKRRKRSRYKKLISEYCGKLEGQEVAISDGPKALVELITGPNHDFRGRGFAAEYEFIDELPPAPPIGYLPPTFTPPLITPYNHDNRKCDVTIALKSLNSTNRRGMIRSVRYPDSYPGDLRCEYSFISSGNTRIQIIFREFNLYLPNSTSITSCLQKYDHLSAYVMLGDRMSEIKTFCGSDRPPRIMSAKNYLSLEFIAKTTQGAREHTRKQSKYRFEIEYRFVDDFGISYAQNRIQQNPLKECHFLFNSTLKENGTMRSPNYPGLYPRKTDCEYEFHGEKTERIRIQFTYFDVEGYPQCHNDSQSDYVIFSNYASEDRTNQRYCGIETPMRQPVVSESNYFRMIFHSNAIFDGTGFFAFYQFVNASDEPPLRNLKPSHSAAVGIHASCILPLLLFILLLANSVMPVRCN